MENGSQTELMKYVKADLEKYDGLIMPVKAGFLEQVFIKKLSPKKLHPNPQDEFCSDEVGPNYSIVEKYIHQIRKNREYEVRLFDEPVIIEKIRPDGYLLLNGHHRWGAALMLDLKTMPVKITNLTQPSDIVRDLSKTTRDKRASINLDDVVFCQPESEPAEKSLFFPYNRIYRERIRKGIPSLFYALHEAGYDVWVYTSGYASTDYIRQMFRHYRIKADGIINGMNHKAPDGSNTYEQAKTLMEKKYKTTLHIETDHIVRSYVGRKDFDDLMVGSQDERWANNVISIIRGLKEQ